MAQTIPNDPVMLLSFVNTQLRDHYSSFEEFCKTFLVEPSEIEQKLNSIDYTYDAAANQFI